MQDEKVFDLAEDGAIDAYIDDLRERIIQSVKEQ